MNNKLIGNTPMVGIVYKYKGIVRKIYAKLEYYNYSGSIKDRIAFYILNQAKEKGLLKEGMPIIEATSGNTGIAFAALGALYNHPVHIFLPDWVSIERQKILELYGAQLHLISKEEGGFQRAIKEADKLALEINGFRPNQFDNIKNIEAHYNTTGLEIINSIPKIDSFVSGIGTGGTLIGIGKRIKETNKNAKVIALEPLQMPIMSQNITTGTHRIEGIGDDFIPSIVDKSLIDEVITIDDEDAINMSRILARKYGIGVGISSGANLLASILTAKDNDNVVTIFADDFKKYLTTDLIKDINNNNLISNQIEILSIKALAKN